jgi:O-antigen biosynthesis protein
MLNSKFCDADGWYYNVKKERIVALIPRRDNSVLDIGCGSGKLGEQLLKQGRAREMVGVEIFPAAARAAAKIYSRIIEGDIEKTDLEYSHYFDFVICGDILEHLTDPWMLLPRIRGWLKIGGSLVVSIPNARYFQVIWNLAAKGNWEYADAGILDKTHLRFFTKSTLLKMIREGGLTTTRCDMVIHGKKKELFNRWTLGLFYDLLGAQIQAIAVNRER